MLRYTMRIPLSLAVATLLLTPFAGRAAGFDCLNAQAPIELTICNDPVLNALDEEVTRLYNHAPQTDSRRQEQRDWLAARLARCAIPRRGPDPSLEERWRTAPCLVQMYRDRVLALGGTVDPLPKPDADVIHPLCLTAALSPFGEGEVLPIDRKACAAGTAHIPVDRLDDGWISAGGADLGLGTWTAYRAITDLPDGMHAALVQFNTGGTGIFSSLISYSVGDQLRVEPLIGGGDRCNGGITAASYHKPDWLVRFAATPVDVAVEIELPESRQEELPYCAICCVGEVEIRFDPEGSETVQALYRNKDDRVLEPETPAETCLLQAMGDAEKIPVEEFPAVRNRFEACMARQ